MKDGSASLSTCNIWNVDEENGTQWRAGPGRLSAIVVPQHTRWAWMVSNGRGRTAWGVESSARCARRAADDAIRARSQRVQHYMPGVFAWVVGEHKLPEGATGRPGDVVVRDGAEWMLLTMAEFERQYEWA